MTKMYDPAITLTDKQIQFAIKNLEYLKVCDEQEHLVEAVDTAIIALETYLVYAPVINLLNQHMAEAERRILNGDPNAAEPRGLLSPEGT